MPSYLLTCSLLLPVARHGRLSRYEAPRGHGRTGGAVQSTTEASILRPTCAFPGSCPLQRAFGYRAAAGSRAATLARATRDRRARRPPRRKPNCRTLLETFSHFARRTRAPRRASRRLEYRRIGCVHQVGRD